MNICIAFGLVTNILIVIFHFIKLSMCGFEPKERAKCLSNLLSSLLCTAGLGAVGFFWGLLNMVTSF